MTLNIATPAVTKFEFNLYDLIIKLNVQSQRWPAKKKKQKSFAIFAQMFLFLNLFENQIPVFNRYNAKRIFSFNVKCWTQIP